MALAAGPSSRRGSCACSCLKGSRSVTMPPMAARLRYVDPNRERGWFSRFYAAFSNTRVGRLLSAKVVWKLDPYVLRATGGRLGLGLVLPTALLETRGAKSGA